MIRLLCGEAGSGKSTAVLARMADVLAAGGQAYLLVPEQEAVAREREIMATLPPAAQLRFEVFNFSRLANHVFRQVGGLSYRGITPGGRSLVMWQTLHELAPFLGEYGERAQNDAALTALMRAAVSECKAYAITPERLEQTADGLPADSALATKLRDLALVFGGYNARVAERWEDSEDDLGRLAALLDEHPLFAGAHIFVDSFTSFPASELAVLRRLARQAEELTVTLCCDSPASDALHFAEITRTAAVLRRMAAQIDCPVKLERLETIRRTDDPTLIALGQKLWHMEDPTPVPDSGAVELFSCADPFAEAECAASRIAALVQAGMRYRDIVIIARDADRWRGILDAELERAGIPYFLTQRTDITTKPIIKLLLSALALRANNWRRSDLLTYLKTGCTGLDRAEVDLLEDYITRWQLQGSAITAPDGWTMDPDGYVTQHTDRAAEQLARLNELRQTLTAPLLDFFADLDRAVTAADCAAAVYAYFCRMALPDWLAARAAQEAEQGRDAEAAELIQLWNILLDALDQLAAAFGDAPCPAPAFTDALKLLLAETDIGTIPTAADQVTIGSASMLRADSPRCAILLGLNEGEFPQAMADRGFFSDQDKRTLEAMGLDLSPGGDRRAAQELFFVYRAVTAPRERLICLCHRAGTDAGEVTPSLAMNRITLLLGRKPAVWEEQPPLARLWARETAFPYTALLAGTAEGDALRRIFADDPTYAARTAALDTPITERDCTLSPETADALFGGRMQLSQSKLESYVDCPFAFFCRYLLNLRDERQAQIGYDSVGTYVHAVLERFFSALTVDGVLHLPETEDELNARLDSVIEAYLRDLFAGVPTSARTAHLFARLRRLSRLLIDNLLTEFRQSRFVPVLFELPIRRGEPGSPEPLYFDLPDGTPVWLGGVIDRVDLWQAENGRYYLRVVDYKTGAKAFSREDIEVGYNLQLLLYLFTLCRSRSPRLRDRLGLPRDAQLTPAGMLYCTALARDMTADADETSAQIIARADKDLRRHGLVLDDEEVLRAMDSELTGRYIPCKLSKSKGLDAPESRVTADEFEQLYAKLGSTIRRIAGELRQGKANARPSRYGSRNPCEHCSAAPVCRAARKQAGAR